MFKVIAKNDKFAWEELDGNGVAVAGSELFDTPEEAQEDINRVVAERTPVNEETFENAQSDGADTTPVDGEEKVEDIDGEGTEPVETTEPVEPGGENSTNPLADPVPSEPQEL